MASSEWQRVYKQRVANEVTKSCGTTTSIYGMSSSKQAEIDEVTKSCATKLRDMTLQDDKLPQSTKAFSIPFSKASESIMKLETGSLETLGEIVDLKEDAELSTSSLCEMNTQGTANSASCRQLQQFRGNDQYGSMKVNSPLNTERSNVTSGKKVSSEHHCENEHSTSGLPSRIDLHSDPMSSTSRLTNQLSQRLPYGADGDVGVWNLSQDRAPDDDGDNDLHTHRPSGIRGNTDYQPTILGRAHTDNTEYVVAGERASGVHCDVITSQKKPTSPAMNRPPKEKLETELITAFGKSKLAQYKQMQSRKNGLQLRCKGCDSMGVRYSDLCTIRQIHHTVLDPEFKDRIKAEKHRRPNKFDGIRKTEKIYCKICGGDWGISGIYRRIRIYVLKVSGFTIVDEDHNRHTYSKWKDVPFQANELQKEDMQSLRKAGGINLPVSEAITTFITTPTFW